MTDKRKDSAIPPPLRDSLLDEPDEKRRRIEQVWEALGSLRRKGEVEPSVDDAWGELVRRLESAGIEGRPERAAIGRRPNRRRGLLAGSAIAAAVVVLVGVWFLRSPVTITVDRGAQRNVELPDGSTVEMNSATVLQYARRVAVPWFSSAGRRVRLQGEAFFNVKPGGRRFVVETEHARVEALGTSFNVRSRPGALEGGTKVTLASGRIRLASTANPDLPVTLSEPGTSGNVSEAGEIVTSTAVDAAPLEHVLAWRQRGFAAVDWPLDAILDEVERRYGVTIAPREGVDPTESMSLFYLRGGTADQILRDVCLIQECTYRETSRGFALSAPNPAL